MGMVETVIVLPVLLTVLFGVIELSVMLGRWQVLSNAAREGARLAVVFRTDCNPALVEADVQARVEDYAATLGMTSADLDVVFDPDEKVCGDRNTRTKVTVKSTYQFGVLSNLVEGLSPSLELQASSVMRNEGSG
jgi:Flp pilus assembly protein TadG